MLVVACLGIFKLNATGLSTEDSYTKEFDSVLGQKVLNAHGLADESSPLLVVANAGQAAEVAQAVTGVYGLGTPQPPICCQDGVFLITVPLQNDATSPAAFDSGQEGACRGPRRSRAPTP